MEPQARNIFIGDRLPRFQAAAACLGVGPRLRQAGRFCAFVGGLAVVILLAGHTPATSPVLWAYLVVFGFGLYLLRPDPEPWALPAAGFVILAVLAVTIYADYEVWSRSHVAPQGGGFGIIIELLLAGALFGNYLKYKRNLAATDADTLAELRALAVGVNRADLDQDRGIVELAQRKNRLRLCRLDGLVLLVARHYVAFGRYSKLDAVAIFKPEELALAADGASKSGRPVSLRISAPGIKPGVMKLKLQFLSRVSSLGIQTTGLPTLQEVSVGAER